LFLQSLGGDGNSIEAGLQLAGEHTARIRDGEKVSPMTARPNVP
jgi:hypothetical protein